MNSRIKVLLIASALCVAPVLLRAQNSSGPFSTISVSATVTSLTGGSQSSAATILEGTVPVSKDFSLRVDSLLDSAVDAQGYFGGINYFLPVPKALNPNKVQLFVTGSVGVDILSPGNLPSKQHISGLAGGGFNYDPTGSGHFALGAEVRYGRLPGLGTGNTVIVSFGPSVTW